jgi:TPP-dependent pyruvate/acetoin dehydrogenase alpha subunit
VVFVCENSSPEVQRMLGHKIDYPQLSIDRVSDRASAYGIPGSSHTGWDVFEVYMAAGEAIRRARSDEGPTLLEFNVRQIEGNLEGRLEAKEEEQTWCPIYNMRERLVTEGTLTEKRDDEIKREEAEAVEEAIKYAVGSPEPELLEAFTDVFTEDT